MDNLFANFNFAWPWMGLAVAAVLSVLMITTNIFRRDEEGHRWQDPVWLAWLVVPLLMFHQFEEYAAFYNVAADNYIIVNEVCRVHGYSPYPICPIPPSHFLIVNVLLAWVVAPIAALSCKRNPLVGLCLYGFLLANGSAHLVMSLTDKFTFLDGRHAGLVTGSLLFIPISLWVIFTGIKAKVMSTNAMICTIFAGVIGHTCLLFSYTALSRAGAAAMLTVDVISLFVPLILAALVSRRII